MKSAQTSAMSDGPEPWPDGWRKVTNERANEVRVHIAQPQTIEVTATVV